MSTGTRENRESPGAVAMEGSSTLAGRLSGMATVAGGLLWAVGGSTSLNEGALGITMRGPHLVITLAALCSLAGLTRLASHQASRAGKASAVLAGAGSVVVIASKNVPSSVSDDAAWNLFYLGASLLVLGSLLLGIVFLRTSKARRFGAPLLAIGALGILTVVFLMGPFAERALGTVLLPILFGVAWTVLGYALWSYEARPSGDPRGGSDEGARLG